MTNWKQTAAAAIVTHEAPATADNSDLSLWHQLKAAIEGGKIRPASLDFAKSVSDGFVKYGSFTPRQADAVRNLLDRAAQQETAQASPDAPLAAALRAALTLIAPRDVDFATSLLNGFDRFGSFTDRQRPHAERLVYSATASAPVWDHPASAPEKPVATTCPNICAVVGLNGFSRFTVGSLGLSLKNDGSCIWVKWNGAIVGVIDHGSTEYRATRRYVSGNFQHGQALEALLAIEANPRKAASENGIKTGRCSCCSRPLTDPTSIAIGIGPICLAGF